MGEPLTEPLTDEAIAQLPDGTDIIITWGGGNGPHQYKLRRLERGGRIAPYAMVVHPSMGEQQPDESFWAYQAVDRMLTNENPLTSFGPQRWQSKVWLADAEKAG